MVLRGDLHGCTGLFADSLMIPAYSRLVMRKRTHLERRSQGSLACAVGSTSIRKDAASLLIRLARLASRPGVDDVKVSEVVDSLNRRARIDFEVEAHSKSS